MVVMNAARREARLRLFGGPVRLCAQLRHGDAAAAAASRSALVYFAVYYFSFRWCILRFDLKTPGRDAGEVIAPRCEQRRRRAAAISCLRSAAPRTSRRVDACMTRLRLTLNDPAAIDEAAAEGARRKGHRPARRQRAAGRARPDRRPGRGRDPREPREGRSAVPAANGSPRWAGQTTSRSFSSAQPA